MSCNLVVDIGNTCLKCAVIKSGEIVKSWVVGSLAELPLDEICADYAPQRSVVSASGPGLDEVESALRKAVGHALRVTPDIKFPLGVGYKTTSTLGCDRMATAVGAWSMTPNRNLLVVDCGTAITIDLVTADGVFQGGFISPGFRLRFSALNNFTEALPLCTAPDEFFNEGVPNTTTDAVEQGVLAGLTYEMEGHISRFSEKYSDLSTFFIGGDSFHFEKRIKNAIFAGRDLTFRGLNVILELNADK